MNWHNAREVGLSLLVSPIIGFGFAGGLLLLARSWIKTPALYQPAKPDTPPPLPVRLLLILTCTGVSFAHGSNDGQRGMGLIMLILIGILPLAYAVNPGVDAEQLYRVSSMAASFEPSFEGRAEGAVTADPSAEVSEFLKRRGTAGAQTFAALATINRRLKRELSAPKGQIDARALRTDVYLVSKSIGSLVEAGKLGGAEEVQAAIQYRRELEQLVNFIPAWVKAAVAVTLGLGTMIGWKRIVVTVGEKIGKSHLSYAQGASAELVAMCTIAGADWFGLPVSTTHVLSSGVAGTMAANRSGLQTETVRNLCLAWVLTLPVCVLLGASLFAAALYVFLHILALK